MARQYLEGVWANVVDKGTHVERPDSTHPGRIVKGMTLEQAKATKWDIVLSSVPENDAGLARLAKETGGHFGIQMGNAGQFSDWDRAEFGLVSTNTIGTPNKPYVTYHQEFSLDDFRFEYPPAEKKSVASFVQCFAENRIPYAEFLELARRAPDLDWKVYGAYGSHPEDEFACGNQPSTPRVAEAMRRTRIAWHSKSWSDGYGHVIHNLGATGKPLVGRASYYADKLAGPLWVEGVTSFDMDIHSADELLAIIRRLRDDDDFHQRISENMAARFRSVVSFDEDAEKVRKLLELVLS